ncbi:MAG: Tryptophan synthase alpha chain [Labilithrix sp.]|nr:Tryptophan synthase alpha chain [Labilithrix sp.]
MHTSSGFRSERSRTARVLRIAVVVSASAALGTVFACASDEDVLNVGVGVVDEDASMAPPLVPIAQTDASADGAAFDAGLTLAMCVATECPWPWKTCPRNDGTLPTYACTTNVSDDLQNCGGCGLDCPTPNPYFNLSTACVDGACKYECIPGAFDCNGLADDGCEVRPTTDPLNCGACGNKCADGVRCINGICGCPLGFTDCDGNCVDLSSDDDSCGKCGFSCKEQPIPPLPDGGVVPPHMYFGCMQGKCQDLRCFQDSSSKWEDCNDSKFPDGCEVNLLEINTEHCGKCENKCAPDKKCFSTPETGMACQCQDGKTYCGTPWGWPPPTCVDTESDPQNCGSCGYRCQAPSGTTPTCTHGRCGFTCPEGRADCNNNALDGCEVDLKADPRHCGGCETSCDVGKGQPCVDGKCATQECDAGEVVQ